MERFVRGQHNYSCPAYVEHAEWSSIVYKLGFLRISCKRPMWQKEDWGSMTRITQSVLE